MALPEVLGGAVETLRTDPAGFACLALGAALPIIAEHRAASDRMQTVAGIAAAGLLATGVIHIGNMFRYADRVEASLRANGFDRLTKFRIRAYCPRQVGYVVTGRTGHLEEYDQLCDATGGKRWAFLPHI
jgi:hypothetical protein